MQSHSREATVRPSRRGEAASLFIYNIVAKPVGPNISLHIGKCRAFGAPISISVQLAPSANILAPLSPLSILLLEAKLVGPRGGLKVCMCRSFGEPIIISV